MLNFIKLLINNNQYIIVHILLHNKYNEYNRILYYIYIVFKPVKINLLYNYNLGQLL